MTIKDLQRGDIVRHANGRSYVVICGATPDRNAVAVSEIEVSNPSEWTIVKRHDWNGPKEYEAAT